MTDLQAIILGCIQGATEWLPISSTAHLRVVPALLGWGDPGAAFTAVTQLGTLLSALVYFRTDILNILTGKGLATGDGPDKVGRSKALLAIIVGTIPIVIVGVLFQSHIKGSLRSLNVVATALIGFGLLLGAAERSGKRDRAIGSVTVKDGLLVGLGQACALIPGASRSGTTITAALFVGFDRAAAARFSFLLSLPAVALAGAKELMDVLKGSVETGTSAMAAVQPRPLIIATVLAFAVGLATIDWLIKFLQKQPTTVFIAYRIALGVFIFAGLTAGWLSP